MGVRAWVTPIWTRDCHGSREVLPASGGWGAVARLEASSLPWLSPLANVRRPCKLSVAVLTPPNVSPLDATSGSLASANAAEREEDHSHGQEAQTASGGPDNYCLGTHRLLSPGALPASEM